MKILALLREENTMLAAAFMLRGHDMWVIPHELMLRLRKMGLPAQPVYEPGGSPAPSGIDDITGGVVAKDWDGVSNMVKAVKGLHAREGLDAVLVWSDAPPVQRAAVLAAKSLGIPTFEITHGALNTYKQGHFECESHVDYILAPGQEESDFRSFYTSGAEVIITGKPSFDWMAQNSRLAMRDIVREKIGFLKSGVDASLKRPIVLYGMTWRHPFSTWERDTDLGEATVMETHMNLQAVCKPFMIIKPHYAKASDKHIKEVAAWCEANGIVEYAVTGMDVQALLPAADLVVSHKSSLLVEAVLMDIPAVGFDFRERNDFDFYRNKGIEWVERPGDLMSAMTRCLLDRDVRERLRKEREYAKTYFNHLCDGRATERACEAVERIVSERAAA